jgi:ribosomal protein S18 acetylase RimI-like enzyme
MPETRTGIRLRPLDELDIGAIVRIDEAITGIYRPEVWEARVGYYLRRDPDSSQVAEADGQVIGFMLGDVRAGEFGIEEPSGWIERFGIDPAHRGQGLGERLFECLVAHFREAGATRVRTLADREDQAVTGFLGALGFTPSRLQALEMDVNATRKEPS